jgi:hypothetical protein
MLGKGLAGSDRLPMSLKPWIRLNPQTEPLEYTSSYRIRPVSFVTSLVLHGGVVAILLLNPMQEHTAEASLYREIIQPQEHKVIFYDFRKKLPEVRPARKIGNFPRPRGLELSDQAIIAASPHPKSDKQLIWKPLPKIELPRDLQLPNLIARANTAPPPPPPAEVKKPPEPRKAFVPPSPRQEARTSPTLTDAPVPEAQSRASRSPDALAALKLKKTFILPPPEAQPARSSGAVTMLDAPAPSLSSAGSGSARSILPAGLGTPAPAAGIAPPPNAPVGAAASAGNANADIAIAGLHAAGELKGPLPDGSRSGRFSKAPELGEPASGEGAGSGALTVPDLAIRADRTIPVPRPPNNANRRAILYAESVRSVPADTLSVPLRPSSRTVPSSIDARFEGRSVYTMVVPIENLPDYGGDWILWFAEREQKPGDAPSMRAPVPFRKLEPVSAMLAGNRVERRLQIAAVIKQDGRVDRISLLRRAAPAVEQAVIQDLESWEFKPATRGGMPVDVDVVIEIPFNLTAELASTGSK